MPDLHDSILATCIYFYLSTLIPLYLVTKITGYSKAQGNVPWDTITERRRVSANHVFLRRKKSSKDKIQFLISPSAFDINQ